MSIDVSSIAFPASGISDCPLSGDLGSQIRDRLHHGVPDAGIIERMAGALDATNFGLRPHRRERMRRRRRAQQIVAALYDDGGDSLELSDFPQQLARSHEAVVLGMR